jgi:hypothetical protein
VPNDRGYGVFKSTDYKYLSKTRLNRCGHLSLNRQLDLFILDDPDLFEDRPSQGVSADPEEVRAEMLALLAESRAAKTMPWTEDDVGFYQTVFPQMSNWLPKEEAAQLCLEFDAEIVPLNAA